MMRIQRFVTGLAGLALIASASSAVAQHTITDQYGTEILVDVLPPQVQTQVQQTQSVLDSGGGEGPIEVDELGRFDLGSAGGGRGSSFAPSQDEYLVNQLLGVVLLPSPGEVRLDGWPGVEGIWHDFDEFPQPVGRVLQDYIGKPVSLSSLDRMVKDVIVAYRKGDRPVVDVLLPEQDITSGVVQLVVIESQLARIRVEGADADTEEFIRSQMRIQEGEVIRASEVLQDLSWVNRSPYRKADMVYAPGIEFGTTDVILKSYESKGDWFYLGYEDSGTEFLGRDRVVAGFNFGELFGPRDSLSYQYTADLDYEHVRASSLVYTHALPWRHWVTFFGSFVEIDSDPIRVGNTTLDSGGDNVQLSARYGIPLQGKANREREMVFGFDYKSNESNLEFFDPANAGILQLFGSTAEIFQFSLAYNEKIQHGSGMTEFDIRGVYSPGGLSPRNSDRVFNQARFPTSAEYAYAVGGVEHRQRLGDRGWTARLKLQGQVSNENLQPSEQLGAGGYSTVRGYDESIIRGDHGFWGTVELYAPPISVARIFDWEHETDTLQLLGFFDAANLGNEILLPGEPSSLEIGSVGVGMRWDYSDWFRLRLDYGLPVYTDNVITDESGRFHIGATATF